MTTALVVGAGIAGSAFGTAMRQRFGTDLSIHMVERNVASDDNDTGIILMPNGLAALDVLKIADSILTVGAKLKTLSITHDSSCIHVNLRDVWTHTPWPTIGISRRALQTALQLDVKEGIIRGCAVKSLLRNEDEWSVRFADGSAARYNIIVSADGVGSIVRRVVATASDRVPLGLHYFRFLAALPTWVDAGTWEIVNVSPHSFGFYPIGPNLVNVYILVRSSRQPCPPELAESFVTDICAAWHPKLRSMLSSRITRIHVGEASMVDPPTWGKPTCVFIGDAGHSISPTFSQGASLAIEDAITLASVWSMNASDSFKSYCASREPRVSWAERMARSQVARMRNGIRGGGPEASIALQHLKRMYAPLDMPWSTSW